MHRSRLPINVQHSSWLHGVYLGSTLYAYVLALLSLDPSSQLHELETRSLIKITPSARWSPTLKQMPPTRLSFPWAVHHGLPSDAAILNNDATRSTHTHT